jgi:hypothetical protein
MSDGDETSFENWVSSTSPSSIESQSPRPSSVNSYPRSTSSYGFESDFDTQRQQTHDPPADKLDAPGSVQYVPVVHHATHRCLTPTRKINSGETITRRISWRDNEHVPPSALPLVLLSFIHRRAWLSLCLLEGYQGMTRLRGLKIARESERAWGTPFLPSEPVIDLLFIISEFHVDVVHCTIKDPLEDSCMACMAIYRKCKANS